MPAPSSISAVPRTSPPAFTAPERTLRMAKPTPAATTAPIARPA